MPDIENEDFRSKPRVLFKDINEIYEYLKETGYEIAKPTLYLHRKQGKFSANKKGLFPKYVIDEYAARWAKNRYKKSDKTTAELNELQERKTLADAQKAEAQAEHWRMKTDLMSGSVIELAEFEAEITGRAAIFKSDLENFFRGKASDLIDIVEGNPKKAPELIDFQLEQLEIVLDRYSAIGKEWQ